MTDHHGYSSLAMFVGPDEITAGARNSLPVINPADGETIAQLPLAQASDLDAAITAAGKAFASWSAVSPAERGRILKKAADLIRERIEKIAMVMTLEQGKPLAEARAEIHYGANVIEWYAEEGKRAYGRIIPSSSPEVRHLVIKEPVGVCAAFTPWNFPALTPCRKIGGALAAGCTLVLKAAEETPGTAVEIARALFDAGLPRGALNLVFGDPAAVSAHLIASPQVRKVSFTGSVPVGKILMRLAADGAKRTTMELGGHAPVIVFADADVDRAAAILAASKFRNAGQVCISPTRFYIEKPVYERFVDRFAAFAKVLKVGEGVQPDTGMGPLANERRVAEMERFVADAVEKGARVEAGGRRIGNKGCFYEPTVLSNVRDDALIMNEEPFGPVAPVSSFSDFDEVMARANGLPFGLAAYAFTSSNKTAMRASAQLKSGMVGLNTMAISSPETPFGGVKESGHGQEGGAEGLEAYLDVKLVAQGE
ncbi:MAG: NAD-dependent succinate-semialdehyde dehydrogenase [Parvularculaceae bacterium]